MHIYSQLHRQNLHLDSFDILFTIKSCTRLSNPIIIHHLHSHIIKLGFICNVYVATSLLHSYATTSFEEARKLFGELPVRNAVTWNTMISGYINSGHIEKAREIFDQMPLRNVESCSTMVAAYFSNGLYDHGLTLVKEMMIKEGIKPDQVAVGAILSGCSHMGSIGLLLGKSVHGYVVKNGWELNVQTGTIFVDMYAKCGFLKYASQVFELMKEKNVMCWTALICGAAKHGYGKEVLSLFEMMRKTGVNPNEMTFTGILSACAHTGLVQEGRKYFNMMEEYYGLKPRIQHYGCMIDLFGKAGLLNEAYEVIRTMGFEPNVVIWGSFLVACRDHKKFEMAERVIEEVLRMVKPENDGGVYSLICDLYAMNGKWGDAERVRRLMLEKNVKKARGYSFTQVGNR